MFVRGIIALYTVCSLVSGAVAQELKVKEGVDANLRVGPGSEFAAKHRIKSGATYDQIGRKGDWVKIGSRGPWTAIGPRTEPIAELGWVHSDFVEWVQPLEERTVSAVRIVPPTEISTVEAAFLSPRRHALLLIDGIENNIVRVLSFETGALLGTYELPSESVASDVSFIDERTVVFSYSSGGDGPITQVIYDIDGDTELYKGRPIFGTLYPNTSASKAVISYTNAYVLEHDPVSYEVIGTHSLCKPNCPGIYEKIAVPAVFDRNEALTFVVAADLAQSSVAHLTTNVSEYDLKGQTWKSEYRLDLANNEEPLSADRVSDRLITSARGDGQTWFRVRKYSTGEILHELKDLDLADHRISIHPGARHIAGMRISKADEIFLFDVYELEEKSRKFPFNITDVLQIDRDTALVSTFYDGLFAYDIPSGEYRPLGGNDSDFKSTKAVNWVGRDAVELRRGDGKRFVLDMATIEGTVTASAPIVEDINAGPYQAATGELFYTRHGGRKASTVYRRRGDAESTVEGVEMPYEQWIGAADGSAFLARNSDGRTCTFFPDQDNCVAVSVDNLGEETLSIFATRFSTEVRVYGTPPAAYREDGSTLYISEGRELIQIDAHSGTKISSTKLSFRCHPYGALLIARDRNQIICHAHDNGIVVGEISTGAAKQRIGLTSYSADHQLGIAPGGHLVLATNSAGADIYRGDSSTRLGTLYLYGRDGWLILTADGFYTGSEGSDSRLSASFGIERIYPIDKFRDALYRPDLVAEVLKGDPEGLVQDTAAKVSLEKILQSGAAPEIRLNGELQGELVRAEADIEDVGGGIGRIEWRVNGVVQETDEGKTSDVAELFLAGGENRIELVAYNSDNTIQGRSEALSFTVADDKVSPPRLFVLTVGVDDYSLDQLKLKYAVKDAETVASAFEKAGAGLYGEVFVESLADDKVTRANLDAKFRELAKSVRPNDVFVFFSAGHGKTLDGRFFFIPQDFSGTTLPSIREQGIGHATWQDWFSLIPAQKSLLLFDSCESGSLTETVVGRELRFRAANDFLGNATGRALIAASSDTGVALEGYKDQGVFAWSLIDALSHADRDANGLIDIDELAVSIEETVPRIAKEVFGEKQTPQFKPPMKGFDVVKPIERL